MTIKTNPFPRKSMPSAFKTTTNRYSFLALTKEEKEGNRPPLSRFLIIGRVRHCKTVSISHNDINIIYNMHTTGGAGRQGSKMWQTKQASVRIQKIKFYTHKLRCRHDVKLSPALATYSHSSVHLIHSWSFIAPIRTWAYQSAWSWCVDGWINDGGRGTTLFEWHLIRLPTAITTKKYQNTLAWHPQLNGK